MPRRLVFIGAQVIAAGSILFPLHSSAASPPPNDQFTDRIVLAPLVTVVTTGSNNAATTNPGDPFPDTVWWTYTPPATGHVWLEVTSPTFHSSVFAYSGTNLQTLTTMAGVHGTSQVARVSFAASAGVPYQIAVAKRSGTNGAFDLRLSLGPSFVNGNAQFETRYFLTNATNFVIGSRASSSLWWTWIPPATGLARFNLDLQNTLARLVIRTGAPPTDPGMTLSNPGTHWVEAGKPYHLQVEDVLSIEPRMFGLSAYLIARPPNDDFTNRTELSGDFASVTATTFEATLEPGEVAPPWNQSVWWTWTAPASGVVSIRVQPHLGGYNHGVRLAQGSSFDSIPLSTACCGLPSIATRNVRRGETINFGVFSTPTNEGAFELTLELSRGLANDFLADALPFPPLTYVAGSNSLYTASVSGENRTATAENPLELLLNFGTDGPSRGRSVWWSWIAESNALATVIATGHGFQPLIGIFPDPLNAPSVRANAFLERSANTAKASWTAHAGQQYFIYVDSGALPPTTASGDYQLELFAQYTVASDQFSNRIALAGTSLTVTGSLTGAALELGEPVHLNQANRSVWWTWTAPMDGIVTIRQLGIGPETLVFGLVSEVFTGNSLSSLVLVTNAASPTVNPVQTHVTFQAKAGTAYQIATVAYTSSGQFELGLSYAQPPVFLGNSPASNTVFAAGSDIPFEVSCTDADPGDAVSRVDFYLSNQKIATDSSPPYLTILSNVPSGSYSLRADAIDSTGLSTVLHVPIKISPANDAFAQREAIVGFPAVIFGTNGGATLEPWEPVYAGPAVIGSTWWTWTPPTNGQYVIGYAGLFRSTLLVYRGSNLASLQLVASNYSPNTGNSLTFDASGEEPYAIGLVANTTGPFTLRILRPPPNDDFANRIHFEGDIYQTPVLYYGATFEPGEPVTSDNGSLWWSWTPSTTQRYRVTSSFFMDIYTGSTVTDLSPATLEPAYAGTNYHFRLRRVGHTEGSFMLRPAPTVSNDAFANRAVVASTPAFVTASSREATKELNEPGHPSNAGGKSLWWTWRAPSRGRATFVYNNTFSTLISVYEGTSFSNLARVAQSTNGGSGAALSGELHFWVRADTDYHIAVDGWDGASGDIRFQLFHQPQPSNDMFADAHALPGFTNRAASYNGDATKQSGEPNHGGVVGGKSLWWRWTAPSNISVSISTTGTLFAAAVGVYRGNNLTSLVPVGGATNAAEHPVTFTAQSGVTYRIAIDTLGATTGEALLSLFPNDRPQAMIVSPLAGSLQPAGVGVPIQIDTIDDQAPVSRVEVREAGTTIATLIKPPFQVSPVLATGTHTLDATVVDVFGVMSTSAPVTFSVALPGDRFEHCIPLSGLSARVSGSNKLATRETGEPRHAGTDPYASIWFEWTAPVSGRVCFSTENSAFETRLAVYRGTNLTGLVPLAAAAGAFGSASNSRLLLDVVAGSKYMIALDSFNRPTGSFELTINPVTAFDDLEFASVIAGTGTWSGSNIGTSGQVGEPAHGGIVGGRSVWWRWMAPSDGIYFAQTEGSTFNTVLAVYEGSDLESLRAVTANNDFGESTSSRVVFSAVAERPYLLVVDGVNSETGDIRLTIGRLEYPRLFLRSVLENEVLLELQGEVGRVHRVEASDDLITWSPIHTQTVTTPTTVMSIPRTPGDSARFYRAIQLP